MQAFRDRSQLLDQVAGPCLASTEPLSKEIDGRGAGRESYWDFPSQTADADHPVTSETSMTLAPPRAFSRDPEPAG
eukprot:6190834-Pleurochrysis_carterae.AAC.1